MLDNNAILNTSEFANLALDAIPVEVKPIAAIPFEFTYQGSGALLPQMPTTSDNPFDQLLINVMVEPIAFVAKNNSDDSLKVVAIALIYTFQDEGIKLPYAAEEINEQSNRPLIQEHNLLESTVEV